MMLLPELRKAGCGLDAAVTGELRGAFCQYGPASTLLGYFGVSL